MCNVLYKTKTKALALASAITVADNGHDAPDPTIAHTYITTTYCESSFQCEGGECACVLQLTSCFFYTFCAMNFFTM